MPKEPDIRPDTTVAEVFARWPEAAVVFLKRRMSCVGCVLSPLDTLEAAARAHGLTFESLRKDLLTFLDQERERGHG